MGRKFQEWQPLSTDRPSDWDSLRAVILANRGFRDPGALQYGDYGLHDAVAVVAKAIRENRRIALYADYDVDGTMSCVSWLWYLKAIGFQNVVHYIPCRFSEGYGLNLNAVKHLIDDEKAELIITMDTGITANAEAEYCKSRGVDFICTDHHKIQPDKMPDCIILNPKSHPDPEYQELCGCGITFVLLRKLAEEFPVAANVWTDLLALAGMATICDVVPLNGVNHTLARKGVAALTASQRPVLQQLRAACQAAAGVDETDVGFRLGPRINAVGRLEHADQVVAAFVNENPAELIRYMDECNERRKKIQSSIVEEARAAAQAAGDAPILFLGGDWHPGVVGIAASKLVEEFWRPVWLFCRPQGGAGEAAMCKGSARSLPGFDVTAAMTAAGEHFAKFGGHKAAGGFSFPPEAEEAIRKALVSYADEVRANEPDIWRSKMDYDCELPLDLTKLELAKQLQDFKPFGHGFNEPRFRVKAPVLDVRFYNDKRTGEPKHTAVSIADANGRSQKVMFFNAVYDDIPRGQDVEFLVTAQRDVWQGREKLSLFGQDYAL